ncbi:hypothetical protein ACSBR2_022001 [Camellia fascicularis]
MDNNYATKKRRKDLIEEFVALQHVVSSINYACAMYIVILYAAFKKKEIRLQLPRSPHPYGKQIDHLNRLVNDSDINCHDQLRMNKRTFMLLCGLVGSVGLSDSKYVVLEEQVAMFFNVIAHHTKNRKIKFNFMRSGQTVSKHFNNVLKAVLRLHGLLLKKPEPITANCTDDRWSCFQNCLGALDGTYVKVLAPAIDKPRVLRDAISRPNGLKVPTGHYYLVDAGYTNGEGFLAPYRGQRYHLSTWREGGAPTTPQEFFNMRHSSARNVIERCFGLLKIRWAILRTYSYFPIKTQFRIITACCLLHNLIQREMPMDLDDDENEEMNPPPPVTELGDEMIDVVEASDQWSEWRTALATQMFNEWQASRGMDDTGTTSSRKKGKPRRFWNHHEEVFLITTMKDVIASNPRWKLDNNQFRAGFYNECEKKILSAFPGTDLRASPHIDSKIKFWRKQYNDLQDMLNMSGFGWNDEQKMVLVDSDDVWQNYVRRVPDAKGMRNRPFPFYEDWLILFGKDRATGELAEDPADAVAAMEKEDANATTEEGEQSPVEQFSMNMGDTDYSMSIAKMAKNLGSFIENTNTTMVEIAHRIGYSHDLSQQRRLVNVELQKLPMSNTQRLMAASMIVKDEDKVDLFFSLDENDKMEWVSLLLEGHI